MEPDRFQQAWQAESSQTRVSVNTELLQKEVLRKQRDFLKLILRRDTIEIGVGLLLLPYWIYQGLTKPVLWTWWLGVPAISWVVGYFLVDRRRHPQKPSDPGEPLLACVENSLSQVEHQIWLLRNVWWWYLLPFAISLTAFFGQIIWSEWVPSWDWWPLFLQVFGLFFIFGCFFGFYGFIYYVNQRAVRTDLEPRRRALLALAASLKGEELGDKGSEEQVAAEAIGERAPCPSLRRELVKRLLLALGILLFVALPIYCGALYLSNQLDEIQAANREYPWRSPFSAVRWQESEPEVFVGGEWFKLESIDGVAAADIVAFDKKTYRDIWRKRFEEDLVEVMTVMGHRPGDKVTLVVRSLTSDETRTLSDVPMTFANRKAIRDAARARERAEKEE